MPEIEQELFNRESGRQKERKTQNGKDLTLNLYHTGFYSKKIYFYFFFPRKSNIWNSFNAKVELVKKGVHK